MVRFGSLLGGSVDGADELQEVGLDECIYKVSQEIHSPVTFDCHFTS